jgi:hypothetical protein
VYIFEALANQSLLLQEEAIYYSCCKIKQQYKKSIRKLEELHYSLNSN